MKLIRCCSAWLGGDETATHVEATRLTSVASRGFGMRSLEMAVLPYVRGMNFST